MKIKVIISDFEETEDGKPELLMGVKIDKGGFHYNVISSLPNVNKNQKQEVEKFF